MNRRRFLTGLAALAGGGLVPALARAADGSYDVSYLWVPEQEGALDYRAQLVELLGPQVARDLQVVQGGSGNFGVVYNRSGTDKSVAEQVARAHDRILRSALGGREVRAIAISDAGYQRLYHVGYGVDAERDQALSRFARVKSVLGDGVLRQLFVERGPDGFRTVYKRFGTQGDTALIAQKHTALLARYGITAEPALDALYDVIWAASSRGPLPEPMGTQSAVAAVVEPAEPPAEPEKPAEPVAEKPEPVAEKPDPVAEKPAEPVAEKPPEKKPEPAPVTPKTGLTTRELKLPTSMESGLRNAINERIQGLRRTGRLSSDERSAWYVLELRKDQPLAAINAETPLQCASMVKPYVALGILHQARAGRILYGPVTTGKMEEMIQRSDNAATNWLMDKLGGPSRVHRLMQEHYGELFPTLSIVESIPAYGRTYRNRASTLDHVRFLRAMWRDELPGSGELRRLLNLPGRDRLFTGAPSIPVGTEVYNKTGSTAHLCGDMGILVPRTQKGEEVPYIVVGVIEKRSKASNYGRWITSRANVIRSVSNLVYTQLKRTYDLV